MESSFSFLPPRESNGGVPVNIQDQHSRALDLNFIMATGAPTALAAPTIVDTYTITVDDTTGFVDGTHIGIFSGVEGEGNFFFAGQIGAPVGNVITLDTPMDIVYVIGSNVLPTTRDMNVDGTTRKIFQVGPVGVATGVEVDITRIAGYLEDATSMDDALFGGIDALAKGIVLRKNNGIIQNYWNAKSNGELALICGKDLDYTTKSPAGFFGARFRSSYAGQEKHGVTIRLEPADTLEILIQDDLTDLTAFRMIAQGHIVTD